MNGLYEAAIPHGSGYRDVRPEQVLARLGEARIIDVREPDELSGELGRIAGVESVPLAFVAEASRRWAKDAPLVVVCRSGGRSGRAAAVLAASGFTRVMNMAGGMLAWNEAHLPVTGRGGP